jgi:hypothetical protein
MPISKTCYFCENLMGKHAKCQKHWKKSSFADSHSVIACKDDFAPNADWLYMEGLHQRIIELEIGEKLIEKENEELKKYKEETEKWLGSSPYIYVNEDEVNK